MRRMAKNLSACVIVWGALLSLPVSGQEVSDETIRNITNAVRDLCNSPDREGKNFSFDAQAEGGTIVKMIGVAGEVSLSKSEWVGIKDYLSDRADLRACVRHLTPIFIEKFKPNTDAGITRDQLGSICRDSQHFELCLDTWTARGPVASVGLSLWNTSGSNIQVCMFRRYASAVSETGETVELRSNRFCWDSNTHDVKKLSYVFEFEKGLVGSSFDFVLEFEQPYTQFVFHNIQASGASSAQEPSRGKDSHADSHSDQSSSAPDLAIVTEESIGREVTLDLAAGQAAPWSKLASGMCMWTTDTDGAEVWLAKEDRRPWLHTGGRASFLYFTFRAPGQRSVSPRYRFDRC